MGLKLSSGDVLFWDTAPFIYYFEKHPVITNDKQWGQCVEVPVVLLDALVSER